MYVSIDLQDLLVCKEIAEKVPKGTPEEEQVFLKLFESRKVKLSRPSILVKTQIEEKTLGSTIIVETNLDSLHFHTLFRGVSCWKEDEDNIFCDTSIDKKKGEMIVEYAEAQNMKVIKIISDINNHFTGIKINFCSGAPCFHLSGIFLYS